MSGGVKRKRPKRIRAHLNPLSDLDFDAPTCPDSVDWSVHFPHYYPSSPAALSAEARQQLPQVRIADIGCGFGGLLVALSPLFPEKLIMGLEIRPRVVEIVRKRILRLREENKGAAVTAPGQGTPFNNVSVAVTNFMKSAPHWFRKGQLEKIFFLFPDPHFKKANFRRRVIQQNLLAVYAYLLQEGGLAYTITDVRDLHEWMVKHFSEHPLFERVPMEELKDDPCIEAITNKTEEGQKVTRQSGHKFPAVFRRVKDRGPLVPPEPSGSASAAGAAASS